MYVNSYQKMKGLEFPIVFVPHLNSIFEAPEDEYDEVFLSKQRRKLFTAMTRARDTLILSYHSEFPDLLRPLEPYVWKDQR